jgi:hypothetical protein
MLEPARTTGEIDAEIRSALTDLGEVSTRS